MSFELKELLFRLIWLAIELLASWLKRNRKFVTFRDGSYKIARHPTPPALPRTPHQHTTARNFACQIATFLLLMKLSDRQQEQDLLVQWFWK